MNSTRRRREEIISKFRSRVARYLLLLVYSAQGAGAHIEHKLTHLQRPKTRRSTRVSAVVVVCVREWRRRRLLRLHCAHGMRFRFGKSDDEWRRSAVAAQQPCTSWGLLITLGNTIYLCLCSVDLTLFFTTCLEMLGTQFCSIPKKF